MALVISDRNIAWFPMLTPRQVVVDILHYFPAAGRVARDGQKNGVVDELTEH